MPLNNNSVTVNPFFIRTSTNFAGGRLPDVTVCRWNEETEDWDVVERLGFNACVEKYGVDRNYLHRMIRGEERDHTDPNYTPDLAFY